METQILDTIDTPSDLKKLDLNQLKALAAEIRPLLLNKVSQTGGHVGPNLGDVELTIALHTVFDSPVDHMVWDVSHQSYTHKILTGRRQSWEDPAHFHDAGPYTDPAESPHDYYQIGHTSTSIALAYGMAVARDHENKHNRVIAIIGDGSLSGGLAFEALSNAGTLDSNLIIVVNDNDMSIAENHGGLYQGLKRLRETQGKDPNNIFTFLGLDYRYVENGNDLDALLQTFNEIKDVKHPIVVHVQTEKGKGYAPAVANKELYHWRMPFDLETGADLVSGPKETYNDVVLKAMETQLTKKTPLVAITAAIPGIFDLKTFAAKHPTRYYDVGIAEQMSISMAAGLAQQGMRPIAFENGTFLQRAYDQISHDLGVNQLPAVLVTKGGNITGGDPTHQATFDMAMLGNIPSLRFFTPTSKEELTAMLDWALHQDDGPVAIRVPGTGVISEPLPEGPYEPLKMNVLQQGSKVALMGVGSFLPLAQAVAQTLAKSGISATVIDPRLVSDLKDVATLNRLSDQHQLVVTFEEDSLDGGFGQKVAAYYGHSAMATLAFGAKKRFDHRQTRQQLLEEAHLTPELAAQDILDVLH